MLSHDPNKITYCKTSFESLAEMESASIDNSVFEVCKAGT